MRLGTATEATDGFAPLRPVNQAVDDLLPALTNDLMAATENVHRALVRMRTMPTPQNSLALRECRLQFNSLEERFSHLGWTAEYALDRKLPENIRPYKRGR